MMSDFFSDNKIALGMILCIDPEKVTSCLTHCDEARKIEIREKIQNFIDSCLTGKDLDTGTAIRKRAGLIVAAIDASIVPARGVEP